MAYAADLSFLFSNPTRIVFGPGTAREAGVELRALGCGKALLVTDGFLREKTDIILKIEFREKPILHIPSRETVDVEYCDVLGGFPGTGNIDADPLFARPGYWADPNDPNVPGNPSDPNAIWVDGDYHLKSQAGRWDPNSQSWVTDDVTSPCIDAGDPNSPVGDEPQPNGGRINMGAYGSTAEASKSYFNGSSAIWVAETPLRRE